MEEKKDIDRLVGSYKQTNAFLMVVGVLLSAYTINSTVLIMHFQVLLPS